MRYQYEELLDDNYIQQHREAREAQEQAMLLERMTEVARIHEQLYNTNQPKQEEIDLSGVLDYRNGEKPVTVKGIDLIAMACAEKNTSSGQDNTILDYRDKKKPIVVNGIDLIAVACEEDYTSSDEQDKDVIHNLLNNSYSEPTRNRALDLSNSTSQNNAGGNAPRSGAMPYLANLHLLQAIHDNDMLSTTQNNSNVHQMLSISANTSTDGFPR